MEGQGRPSHRYDVFISFVASADYKTARIIKNFLGSFHKRVEASGLKIPEIRAFMDSDNLGRGNMAAGNTALSDALKQALSDAEHLLVLCSHETTNSDWVRSEFDWFVSAKGDEKVFLGVTEPVDPRVQPVFPSYVTQRNLQKRLWYDFRSLGARRGDRIRPRPIEDVFTQLAAHLTGRSVEEVTSAWYREQRRVARVRSYYIAAIAIASVIAVTGGALAYVWYLSSERSIADKFLQEGLKAEGEGDIISAASAYANSLTHADTPIVRYRTAGLLNLPVRPDKLFQFPTNGNAGRLSALTFVEGDEFAVGDKEGNLLLLNIDDGSVKRLTKFSSSIKTLAYFPNSNKVAAGLDDGEVATIELESGARNVVRKFGQPILVLKADRERDNLAIGVANNEGVFVVDKDAKQLFALDTHTDDVQALAFNYDGTYLYFGGSGPYIWACAVGDGGCDKITRVDQYSYSISASASTRYSLATVGDEVILFDHVLTKRDVLLKSPGAHLYASSFDPTSQFVAVAASDGSITVIDVAAKRVVLRAKTHSGESYALAFDGPGKRFASIGLDGSVAVWILTPQGIVMPSQQFQPTPQMLTPPQRNQIIDVRVLDEKLAVVALADTTTYSFDLPALKYSATDLDLAELKGKLSRSFNRATAMASFGQFDPMAAWKDNDAQAKIEKLAFEAKISSVSADGRFIAIVSEAGETYVLDSTSNDIRKSERKVLKPTAVAIMSIEPLSIAVANEDGDLVVMKGAELAPRSHEAVHARAIRALLYSKAGDGLLAMGDDGFVGIIDPEAGRVRRSVAIAGARSLALSPDGRLAAIGTLTGNIEIVDLETMGEVATIPANSGGVAALVTLPR
ncbi:toll/interleukin-1 receptor domain-containing protein [Ensifer adhaerens]|uniref:toll/interleukin-1 receptor domain-containing protein n=1 Tax=Ensifer adhaerens TaxID=106592 RepID=UPI00384B993C